MGCNGPSVEIASHADRPRMTFVNKNAMRCGGFAQRKKGSGASEPPTTEHQCDGQQAKHVAPVVFIPRKIADLTFHDTPL
jgi:hypothetical protein